MRDADLAALVSPGTGRHRIPRRCAERVVVRLASAAALRWHRGPYSWLARIPGSIVRLRQWLLTSRVMGVARSVCSGAGTEGETRTPLPGPSGLSRPGARS